CQYTLSYLLEILLKLVVWVEAKAPFLLAQCMGWQESSHGLAEDILRLLPLDFQMPRNAERKTHKITIEKRYSDLQTVCHRCTILIHQEVVHQLRVKLSPEDLVEYIVTVGCKVGIELGMCEIEVLIVPSWAIQVGERSLIIIPSVAQDKVVACG